jgi:hypothetical protein
MAEERKMHDVLVFSRLVTLLNIEAEPLPPSFG